MEKRIPAAVHTPPTPEENWSHTASRSETFGDKQCHIGKKKTVAEQAENQQVGDVDDNHQANRQVHQSSGQAWPNQTGSQQGACRKRKNHQVRQQDAAVKTTPAGDVAADITIHDDRANHHQRQQETEQKGRG
jgi:hypothetical protein